MSEILEVNVEFVESTDDEEEDSYIKMTLEVIIGLLVLWFGYSVSDAYQMMRKYYRDRLGYLDHIWHYSHDRPQHLVLTVHYSEGLKGDLSSMEFLEWGGRNGWFEHKITRESHEFMETKMRRWSQERQAK